MAFFLMIAVPFPSPFASRERLRCFLRGVVFRGDPQGRREDFGAHRRAMGTDGMKAKQKRPLKAAAVFSPPSTQNCRVSVRTRRKWLRRWERTTFALLNTEPPSIRPNLMKPSGTDGGRPQERRLIFAASRRSGFGRTSKYPPELCGTSSAKRLLN